MKEGNFPSCTPPWAGEEAASPPFMCTGSSTSESASVTFMPSVLPFPDWPSHAFACSHGAQCALPLATTRSKFGALHGCEPHRRWKLHDADSQPFVPMVPKCIRLHSPGLNVKVLRCPSCSPPITFLLHHEGPSLCFVPSGSDSLHMPSVLRCATTPKGLRMPS